MKCTAERTYGVELRVGGPLLPVFREEKFIAMSDPYRVTVNGRSKGPSSHSPDSCFPLSKSLKG